MRRYLFFPNSWYFLTYKTKNSAHILKESSIKEIILNKINKTIFIGDDFFSFSVLDNHLHLLVFVDNAKEFANKLQSVIGGSAFEINRKLGRSGSIWGRHFVLPVNGEDNLFRVSSYVLGNPLRHGLVKNLDELYRYMFSNFHCVRDKKGKDFAENLVLSGLKLKVPERLEELFWKNILEKQSSPHS